MNFADTHTRTNSYVQKATLPLIPGGEVAGVREDSGERVVALVGEGGYAQYATAPQERVFLDSRRRRRRYGARADRPGHDRVASLPHGRAPRRGRERRRPRRGRRGRLAGRAARPSARRRASDRDRLQRGEARARHRARRRRSGRSFAGGPHRAPDRGQSTASPWTWSSRCPAARSSRPPTGRSRRSGGSFPTGSPPTKPTRWPRARCCAIRAR